MIYNESTKSFIKLETALKELGFDQQTIDLALEYLDITNPRNNELMRKITTRYYPKFRQYNYREKLDKAVKSEISDTGSDELKRALYYFQLNGNRSIFPLYDKCTVLPCLYIFPKQGYVYEAAHRFLW